MELRYPKKTYIPPCTLHALFAPHHDSISGDLRDDARGRNAILETVTANYTLGVDF